MSLPASGPISMSMINTEAGLASNNTNSSLDILTGLYIYSGVDQNIPLGMSEFYGVTYFVCTNCQTWTYDTNPTGNPDTIYYYSCTDGTLQSMAVSAYESGFFCNCDSVNTPYVGVDAFILPAGYSC